MAEREAALLECAALDVRIAEIAVCANFELSVRPGERWALLGRNGIGKTTLLHTLAGLREPSSGHATIAGHDLRSINRRALAQIRGVLFQHMDDPFPATALATALLGRHPHVGALRPESAEDYAIARDALRIVGIDTLAERTVDTLSGGERQRLGIAALLAQRPRLLLLDEPTNHLDLHHQIEILTTLHRYALQIDGAWIMTLHDLNLAERFCDRCMLLLGEGRAILGSTREVLTPEHVEQAFRHRMERIEHGGRGVWIPA